MEKIRKCNLYCEHFSDVLVEFFCRYKQRVNVACGADCFYRLPEVSEIRKAEVDSKLEKEIEFQEIVRTNPKKIKGAHNLKTVI